MSLLKQLLSKIAGAESAALGILEGSIRRLRVFKLAPADRAIAGAALRAVLDEAEGAEAIGRETKNQALDTVKQYEQVG